MPPTPRTGQPRTDEHSNLPPVPLESLAAPGGCWAPSPVHLRNVILQTDALWSLAVPHTAGPAAREILASRIWADQSLWGIGDSSVVVDRGPQLVAD